MPEPRIDSHIGSITSFAVAMYPFGQGDKVINVRDDWLDMDKMRTQMPSEHTIKKVMKWLDPEKHSLETRMEVIVRCACRWPRLWMIIRQRLWDQKRKAQRKDNSKRTAQKAKEAC